MVTINGITYDIHVMDIGGSKILTKNGRPVLLIPEELEDDFVKILSAAGAAMQFISDKEEKNKQDE